MPALRHGEHQTIPNATCEFAYTKIQPQPLSAFESYRAGCGRQLTKLGCRQAVLMHACYTCSKLTLRVKSIEAPLPNNFLRVQESEFVHRVEPVYLL